MRPSRVPPASWALRFFGVAALAALAAAGAAAAAKSCTFADIPLLYTEVQDLDGDLLNDSFFIETQYAPAPPEEVWLNATVLSPNGSVADLHIGTHSTDDLNYTFEDYTFALVNTTDLNGTYLANVTFDYTNGSCTQFLYPFELYPPGVYGVSISGGVLDKTADENATVLFPLTLSNDGNNPDSFSFYLNGGLGWTHTVVPLNPTLGPHTSVTVNISVSIPHNAAPLSVDAVNLTVTSSRSPGTRAYLDFSTTVAAQVFAINVTMDNASQAAIIGTTLTYVFHVANLGNNRDTMDMAVTAAPSGWQRTVPGGILVLNAGDIVGLAIEVTLPSSYTSSYAWDFWVNITAGDGVTSQSVEGHARVFLPDFVIGPAGLVVNNSAPDVGSFVQVQVTVLNVGGPIQVTFAVSLTGGGPPVTVILDMRSAGFAVALFNWTAVAGATTLDAFADSTSSVPEDNETNNHRTLEINANAPPTAVAESATAAGHPGEAITISAAGSSDLDGSVTEYFFAFGDGTNSGWVAQTSVTHAYNATGNYTVSIRVRDNRGSESQPVTELVAITPPGSGGGGGGGGENGNNTGGNGNNNNGTNGTGTGCGSNCGPAVGSPFVPLVAALAAAAAVGALLMLRMRKKPGAPSAVETPPVEAPPPAPKEPPDSP